MVVADVQHRLAHQFFQIDPRAGRDFPGHDHDAGLDERLAGHAAFRVFAQDGVEHGVGNLIGHLIGMAF
jgi:hypothetical protein